MCRKARRKSFARIQFSIATSHFLSRTTLYRQKAAATTYPALQSFLGHGAYSFLNSLHLIALIATAKIRSHHAGKHNAGPRLMVRV
jgi:hypothetical protein